MTDLEHAKVQTCLKFLYRKKYLGNIFTKIFLIGFEKIAYLCGVKI